MKSTITLKSMTLIALLGAALAAPVWAQGGGGMGAGMGGGPGMMQNAGGGAGMGPGGGRGMRFNKTNTPGWSMMTQEERVAHQSQMRSAKTYDECKQLQAEHRVTMEARAKEKGVTLRNPRQLVCDRMQANGFFK